jgi:hypothetical protein
VTCHTDEDGITCSNDIKCPDGFSNYSSNFTFGQNQADTWSPNSQNQADTLVQQQQHIAISSCAKFSLTSDGTRDGTRVEDEVFADENTCPKMQKTPKPTPTPTPTPTVDRIFAEKPSVTRRPHAEVTIMPQMLQNNHAPKESISKSMYLLAVLIVLLVLLPGAHASADIHRRDELRKRAELRVQDVRNKVDVFAQNFSEDLVDRVTVNGMNGELFAHNLVADVVSSVCTEYFKGTKPGDFTPVIIQNCVKSVYGGAQLVNPADQFSAVFGASLLCGYIVSEAYPAAQEFAPSGCDGLRELARRISQAESATIPVLATIVASQSSRSLVSEPSAAQSPSFRQTMRTLELAISPSFNTPSLSLPQFNTPGPSPTRIQLSSLDPNTFQTPLEHHTTRSRSQSSLLSKSGVDVKVLPSTSDSSSPRVVLTLSPQSSEPSLPSLRLFPSEEEYTSHEATTSPSRQVSFASRSLIDILPGSVSGASRYISSQAHPDTPSPSQSTVAHRPPLSSSSSQSSLLFESTLFGSSSTVAQSSATQLERISPSRSTSESTSRIDIPDLPSSRFYDSSMIPSSSLPVLLSTTSPPNGSTRTSIQIAISHTVDVTMIILAESAPVSLLSLEANNSSVSTIRSSDILPANHTTPLLTPFLSNDNSATTITPMYEPSPTVVTNSADFCTNFFMSKSTPCSCDSTRQNSTECCKGPYQCPDTDQSRPEVTWESSVYNHSSTFETLSTMLSSDAPWVLSSNSSPASSIENLSARPVSTTDLVLGLLSATESASLVQSVLQSPTERPTSGRQGSGGFIAKGFNGWW